MATGPAEQDFDGLKVTLGLLGTTDALDLLTRLTKLVGPLLTAQMGEGGQGAEAAVGGMFRHLETKDIMSILSKLLGTALVDGQPLFANGKAVAFDLVFQGRLALMFRVVAWAMGQNYQDFGGLLDSVRSRVEANPKLRAAAGALGWVDTSTSKTTGSSTAA